MQFLLAENDPLTLIVPSYMAPSEKLLLYLNTKYVDTIGPNHVTWHSLKRTSDKLVKNRCNSAQ